MAPCTYLILLNVNNNEWFLPQDTSEPLKICFIYVSSGAGCEEEPDIVNKSQDMQKKKRWGGAAGKSGWKWSTSQIDQLVWGYVIGQEGHVCSVHCRALSVFTWRDLWPYLEYKIERSIHAQTN